MSPSNFNKSIIITDIVFIQDSGHLKNNDVRSINRFHYLAASGEWNVTEISQFKYKNTERLNRNNNEA